MTNIFEKWEIVNLDKLKNLYIDSINYNSELNIILVSEFLKIEIIFERFISYRVNDESYLLEYWEILDNENLNGYVFYKMIKSSFFNEMKYLSKDYFTDGGEDLIRHYCIFTINECVEILSDLQPIVRIGEIK